MRVLKILCGRCLPWSAIDHKYMVVVSDHQPNKWSLCATINHKNGCWCISKGRWKILVSVTSPNTSAADMSAWEEKQTRYITSQMRDSIQIWLVCDMRKVWLRLQETHQVLTRFTYFWCWEHICYVLLSIRGQYGFGQFWVFLDSRTSLVACPYRHGLWRATQKSSAREILEAMA